MKYLLILLFSSCGMQNNEEACLKQVIDEVLSDKIIVEEQCTEYYGRMCETSEELQEALIPIIQALYIIRCK